MLKLGVEDVILMIDHDENDLQKVTNPSDLKVLQDQIEKVTYQLPTKGRILRQIRKAIRDTSVNALFISYAGHGIQGPRRRQNREESDGKDEYICTLGANGKFVNSLQSFISDDELMRNINSAAGERDSAYPLVITYVFDCCHSGTVFDLPHSQIRLPNGVEFRTEPGNTLLYQHVTISGWSGCQDNQLSREDRISNFMSEGRCTKSFVKAVGLAILESDMSLEGRAEITHFDLHALIMRILFQIDKTDDQVISTNKNHQVINYSSSRNIGLDTSGKKLVSRAFVFGTKLPSHDYDEIVRIVNRSSYPNLRIEDRDPIDLHL